MYEVEYKIIGTALMAEQENRDRIFREVRPEYFGDKTTAEIFRCLSESYQLAILFLGAGLYSIHRHILHYCNPERYSKVCWIA